MKSTLAASMLVVLMLAACSSDPDKAVTPVNPLATTPTSVVATSLFATEPAPVETPAPPVRDVVEPVTPIAVPAAAETADPTTASTLPTGQDLYEQTCQQFITAIDALEKAGLSDRKKSLDGLSVQLKKSAEWDTVPADDQKEMLRGLDAAGRGRC